MTNFVLVVVTALSGLIIQQRFSAATILVGVFITLIGLYGAVFAAKYRERASYHLSQAHALTATLKDMNALVETTAIDEYRQRHHRAFPRLGRVRLQLLWTGFHLVIIAYGASLTAIAVLR